MKKPIQLIPADVIMCGNLIANLCEQELGVSKVTLRSRGRYHYLVAARAACYFLLHTINNFKITDISGYFNKDHASVLHGLTTHQELFLTDHKGYRNTFRTLETAYKFKLADIQPEDSNSALKQIYKIDKMIKDLENTKKFLMNICVTNNELTNL